MDAVILVGGRGTRLRPLTLDTPKPMLPVAGRPLIERVVAGVAGRGVDRVVLSLGYRPDAFITYFHDDRIAGLPVHYAVEPEQLDTGGAIRFAAEHASVDGPFWVLNGDVLADRDLDGIRRVHNSLGADATIALIPVDDPSRFGLVTTDDDGRVTGFVEKPEPGTAPTNEISAGTYLFEPSVLEMIPPDRRVSVERETFPALVEAGALAAHCSAGYWLDTGTAEQFRQACRDVAAGDAPPTTEAQAWVGGWRHPTVSIPLDADIVSSFIGEGSTVGTGSRIVETTMGTSVRIGAGSELVDVVVMDGATIGPTTRVSHSVIGYGAAIAEQAVLDDCVVGTGAVVGAGEHLSGVRRPGDADGASEPGTAS